MRENGAQNRFFDIINDFNKSTFWIPLELKQ